MHNGGRTFDLLLSRVRTPYHVRMLLHEAMDTWRYERVCRVAAPIICKAVAAVRTPKQKLQFVRYFEEPAEFVAEICEDVLAAATTLEATTDVLKNVPDWFRWRVARKHDQFVLEALKRVTDRAGAISLFWVARDGSSIEALVFDRCLAFAQTEDEVLCLLQDLTQDGGMLEHRALVRLAAFG